MKKQKVIIVNEGQLGHGLEERSNDGLVKIFFKILSDAEQKDINTEKMEKIGDVQVVNSTEEAIKMVKSDKVDCLIFNSRSMISIARKIKKERPQIKILVFTELVPENEIIILNKAWLINTESLRTIVFHD